MVGQSYRSLTSMNIVPAISFDLNQARLEGWLVAPVQSQSPTGPYDDRFCLRQHEQAGWRP